MRYAKMLLMSVVTGVLLFTGPSRVSAQAPAAPPANETATQFYTRYQAAFAKATKVEDLLPWMAPEIRKMVESEPVAERPKTFEMIKMLSSMHTGVKVVREQRTATGATLTAEAIGEDKQKATGTIEIVREGNAWKMGKESWKN
jgi:hypothetical protein